MRERVKSLTFAYFLRTCALTALLTFPAITGAETNLRAADQIVRQAKVWNAAGKYEEARDALVRYLERDSRSVVARLEYARTLSYLRQFPEALTEYQHVLTLEPENLEAQVGVAKVASWRGQFENALNLYRQILAHTPGLHDALVGKAHTLVWLGRKDEAITVFLDALERNPSDRDVRRALEDMGVDVDAALAAAQRRAALSVRPEPQLADLPAFLSSSLLSSLPDELWIATPDRPTAAPAAPEEHAKTAAPVQKKAMRAPPPASPAQAAPVEAALPPPLVLQAAALLIFLAGGALAYRTSIAHLRRRPLPVTRRPYELPPSSWSVEAHVGAGAPACPAERSSAQVSATRYQPAKAEPPARASQPARTEHAAKVEPVRVEQPVPPVQPNTLLWGRVLVVHPDEQVLEFARRVLAGAGAEVLALRRGEDALVRLEKSRQDKSGYDALLVNDRLPGGRTGMEIYRWVKQYQPGAERSVMLVHSGQSDTHTEQFLEESDALGVAAPFNVSDLLAMTRLALDKAKTAPRA
ncbi:MAG: tetratricopeptide repeat protein [Acidobacteria bacterium]|nr:tetratricopeptide repeat protein [Acidobacteriota bacterium]